MPYRVTNPDGLRALGTKLANEGNIVSDEFFEEGVAQHGWEGYAEKISKTEAKKGAAADKDENGNGGK